MFVYMEHACFSSDAKLRFIAQNMHVERRDELEAVGWDVAPISSPTSSAYEMMQT
jgi:hypothetical protein